MVSPVRRDGTARQCAMTDGAAMTQARRRKERTHPELAQVHGRARLVVVACEVGADGQERPCHSCTLCRRRKHEANQKSSARSLRGHGCEGGPRCWGAQRPAFALCLFQRRCTPGGSGPTSSEVYRDHRCEEFLLIGLFSPLRAKKKVMKRSINTKLTRVRIRKCQSLWYGQI